MPRTRLETFSDGVIAILITIMVLELRVPHSQGLAGLREAVPSLLVYLLSFVYVAIYWNNHHHMLHLVDRIDGRILWANMHLLFWLSLVPFVTAWVGEHHLSADSLALYGTVFFMAGLAYLILQSCIIALQGPNSRLRAAVGKDSKGKASAILYLAAIGLGFFQVWLATTIYALVALMWLIPDRRIESHLASD